MSTLRWILFIVGIIVVVAVYFTGRRNKAESNVRQEPALDTLTDEPSALLSESPEESQQAEPDDWEQDLVDFDNLIAEGLESEIADYRASDSDIALEPAVVEKKPTAAEQSFSMLLDDELVILHLLSKDGMPFSGETLYSAFSSAGFKRIDSSMFSCRGNEGNYLAVNALKPGVFPENAEELQTKAIGLILRLSQSKLPLAAFDEMLLCAKFLQDKLDARLCDSQRSSLTLQTIHYLQEEIQAYQHKHRQ